ncbi:hypothetical protein MAHJHV28_46730 [Mycobacterium avium subsp. hominissuis]
MASSVPYTLAAEAYRLLMEVLGTAATVRQDSPGALLRGPVHPLHPAAQQGAGWSGCTGPV